MSNLLPKRAESGKHPNIGIKAAANSTEKSNKSVSPKKKYIDNRFLSIDLTNNYKINLEKKTNSRRPDVFNSILCKENVVIKEQMKVNNKSKDKSIIQPKNWGSNNSDYNSIQIISTTNKILDSNQNKLNKHNHQRNKSKKLSLINNLTDKNIIKNTFSCKESSNSKTLSKHLEINKLIPPKSFRDINSVSTTLKYKETQRKISIDLTKDSNSKDNSFLSFIKRPSNQSFNDSNKRSFTGENEKISRNPKQKNVKNYSFASINNDCKFKFDKKLSFRASLKSKISPLHKEIFLEQIPEILKLNTNREISPLFSNRVNGGKEIVISPLLISNKEPKRDTSNEKDTSINSQFNTLTTLRGLVLKNNKSLSMEVSHKYKSSSEKNTKLLNDKRNETLVKKGKNIKKYDYVTKTGYAGFNQAKINQDSYFIKKKFIDDKWILFSVSDGHGVLGHEISKYLKENLPKSLESEIKGKMNNSNFNFKKSIVDVFLSVNSKLFADPNIDSHFSGATFVSVIHKPEKLICCNVGDSRAIVGRFNHETNTWSAEKLSNDHKPNLIQEKMRIKSKNGRVEPYQDESGTYIGPYRVWLKDQNIPGLAMSRSFGDQIGASVGIISEPEIIEHNITQDDMFFILASDGLWEFMENDEVVNIVKEFYLKDDIIGATQYLLNESTKRWMKEEEIVDDITIIIVFLENV